MTESSPQTAYASLALALSWLVIAATVLVVAIRVYRQSHNPNLAVAVDEFQLSYTGRMAVGSHSIFAPPGVNSAAGQDQWLSSLTPLARTPRQKLQAACVIAEIKGPESALTGIKQAEPLLESPGLRQDASMLRSIYAGRQQAFSGASRQQLVSDLGWFGKLALTFNAPAGDPTRAELLRTARRAFLVTLGVWALIGLAILAGLVLFVLAIIFLGTGTLRTVYRPAASFNSAFLETFAIYIAGYVGIGYLFRRLAPGSGYAAIWVALVWVVAAAVWPLRRGVSWNDLRQGLGWHPGRGIFREMGCGIVGYIAGVPIVALGTIACLALMRWTGTISAHPFMFSNPQGLWPALQLYLLGSVWAPAVEETMFRGALFHHLRQRHRWLLSAALSALIFASVHPQGWPAIPVIGGIGFVLAGIREWRGTAVASAAAHAVNNGVMVTMLILLLGN